MAWKNRVSIWIALTCFGPSLSLVAEEIKWTHFGIRPLAMGNAFVAVADDYNALFYNPAGLARLKEWDGEFMNPSLEASKQTLDFIGDLQKISGGSASGISEVLDILEKQAGKIHRMAFYATPHFVTKNFGIGLGLETSFSMVVHSNIDVELDAGPKLILPISFASSFLEDRLSIGLSVKGVARGGINRSFNIDTISAFSKKTEGEDGQKLEDLVKAGAGVGADIGILFTPIDELEPTLGISITDLGGTPFEKADIGGKSLGNPKARLPSVNTGISIKPMKSDMSYLLLALDAHAINHPSHYSNKINMGAEWGFSKIIKIQTGLKQGYLTAGFQFDVGLLSLRFATYTVDHAPIVGAHKDLTEQRYALQMKLLF